MRWWKKRLLKLALLYDRTNMFFKKNRVYRYLLHHIKMFPFESIFGSSFGSSFGFLFGISFWIPFWISFSIPLRIPFWSPFLSPFWMPMTFLYSIKVVKCGCMCAVRDHLKNACTHAHRTHFLEVFSHAHTHGATTHCTCVGACTFATHPLQKMLKLQNTITTKAESIFNTKKNIYKMFLLETTQP